ncbi:MAG: RNA polymerase sigma-I factor [Bacillota bacterium]|nr:RNA polymerase sigma-I factor [Bacillota bacterium]
MFKFGLNYKKANNSLADMLEKIQAGNKTLKEQFIKDNILYITKVVSNILGIYIDDKNSEEYSIGLSAFNEAIDNYDAQRNNDFFNYSYMVIKHRIIDNVRKNKKHGNVVLFSSIDENQDYESKVIASNSHYQLEKIEIKDELIRFEQQIKEFDISLADLITDSPKHKDSRLLSIKIARVIAEDDELFYKMIRKKRIPLSELLQKIKVNQKTVGRNRKFIIAVSLILRSNLDDIKDIVLSEERREKYV